jgi:hypothetical protein
MRPYYRNLYFPPIIGEKQAVGNVVGYLLSSIFLEGLFDEKSLLQHGIQHKVTLSRNFLKALAISLSRSTRQFHLMTSALII